MGAALIVFLLSAILAASLIWNQHHYRLRHERTRHPSGRRLRQALGNTIEHALSVTYAMAAWSAMVTVRFGISTR